MTEEEADMSEDLTTEEAKDHTEEAIEDLMVDIVMKDKTGKEENQDNLEKEENQENKETLVLITDNSDQTDMKNKTI